jgi:hypothetical protein
MERKTTHLEINWEIPEILLFKLWMNLEVFLEINGICEDEHSDSACIAYRLEYSIECCLREKRNIIRKIVVSPVY